MKNLTDIKNILEAVTGFEGKVVYRAWPEGEAPSLPFICFLTTGSNNVFADDIVYQPLVDVDIELYSRQKDTVSEAAIEEALSEADIPWEKREEWIEGEHVCEIIYSIEI